MVILFIIHFIVIFMNALENKKRRNIKIPEKSVYSSQECTALTLVDQSKDAFGFY